MIKAVRILRNEMQVLLIALIFGFVLLPALSFAAEDSVIDTGTTSWMLISTALVLLMMPGLAMFYGGLVKTKNVLSTMAYICCNGSYWCFMGDLWIFVNFW